MTLYTEGAQEPAEHISRFKGLCLDAAQVDVQLPIGEQRAQLMCGMHSQRRLPHPGHVVEQDVAFHEESSEELLGHLALSDHDRRDVLDEALRRGLNGKRHARTMRPPVFVRRRASARGHPE